MNRADQTYCIGRGLAAITAISGTSDARFIQCAIENGVDFLHRRSQGSTFAAISCADLAQMPIPKRSYNDQTFVADIVGILDGQIEKTEALIAKYQQIKAGLVNDLIRKWSPLQPTTPKLPAGYEICLLRDLVECLDGKRIPLKEDDRSKMQGDIPYYGASGIIDFVDRHIFNELLILVGEDGENVISRKLPLAFMVNGRCWINNHAHVLRPSIGYNPFYLVEYLESIDYTRYISGSAQPKLNQAQLMRIPIVVPSSDQQDKIADALSAAQKSIDSQISYRDSLVEIKAGLSTDLMSGRVGANG